MGNGWSLSMWVLERTSYKIWIWERVQGSKAFLWIWVLSGRKWGKSMTVWVSYLEDWRNEAGPKLFLEKERQSLTLARIGECLVIFVVWKKCIVLSLFRHDYRVTLFLSWCIMVTEWPHLILLFYEIAYVRQNLQALLYVPGQLLAPFVFLTILIFSHVN